MSTSAIKSISSAWDHAAFNWFDLVLVAMLAIGFWSGRKRGMTKEMLPALQWLTILLVAGFGHVFLANLLERWGVLRQIFGNQFNERTAALLAGYLFIMGLLILIFSWIRRRYDQRLEGSSVFGANEYYWGVVAGLVRYTCVALVALALLNAPMYTEKDIEAKKAYNNRWYGGGLKGYNGDYIPTMYEVQYSVFNKSLLGPLIKGKLSMLLIHSTSTSKESAHS